MMKDSHKEHLVLLESYIETGAAEYYAELISGRSDILMIIDWREYDEDIIRYCENILRTGQLEAKVVDSANTQGFELIIIYKDQPHVVQYPGQGADRDSTIIQLNQVLQPDYEIRLCKASLGADTIEFLPLASNSWQKLERRWGQDRVAACFSPIEATSCFFG